MIGTARTTMRPYTAEDIERILPVFSDPVTMRFWPEPFSREQTVEWVRTNIMRTAKGEPARMLVELRETGEVIGDCGIIRAEINGRMENDLGYIIHHPFQRQGYAVECGLALIAHTPLPSPKRIVANMAIDHIGSRRVAEKMGMRLEGTFINERNRGLETCLYVLEG